MGGLLGARRMPPDLLAETPMTAIVCTLSDLRRRPTVEVQRQLPRTSPRVLCSTRATVLVTAGLEG